MTSTQQPQRAKIVSLHLCVGHREPMKSVESADLIADFVCRLLHHMDERGASMATPTLRDEDAGMALLPWVDPENFNPGYLMRSMHMLPRQGAHEPWRHTQDYWSDKDALPAADLDDGALVYD